MTSSLRHVRLLSTAAGTGTGTPSSITTSAAKHRLRSEHDPDKAVEIYTSVSKHYSSPTCCRYTQELTVRRLAKSRRFSEIESLIESHKTDPKVKEERFLCTLIRSYGIAGMFDHALSTFRQMDQLGTPRSVLSFNALLAAAVQSKAYHEASSVFYGVPLDFDGIVPNNVSYGILVKLYCEDGMFDKAFEALREMEDKGLEPSTVSYTSMLDCLYKKGKTDEAEELWREMVRKGCEVDAAAYNVRIMHAQNGQPERVKELIDEMGSWGLKPDTISYNYLMTCYCKNVMLEDANKVYDSLDKNGCHPNATTFRTLVHYYCKNHKYVDAYKVFRKSAEKHKIPDFLTTRRLVEGLVKIKRTEQATRVIRTIKNKFPTSYTKTWKKVEEELGLTSTDDAEEPKMKSLEATGSI